MRSLRVDFTGSRPTFDFEAPVADFDATVQAALVNVGTRRGSDPLYAERGTRLKQDGAEGRMSTLSWANAASNLAALATLSFIQTVDLPSNPFKLQNFRMVCEALESQKASINAQAVCVDGTVIGAIVEL